MVARTLFLASLMLGSIAATPLAVPATAAVETNVKGAHLARGMSADDKIDIAALWAREWFGNPEAPIVSSRDLNADSVIDKVAGWTKDWYHTGNGASVTKREVDTDDVVDTVASWTKEWLHPSASAPQVRDVDTGETVDETVDRVAGKVKNYFQQGGSLTARDLTSGFSSIMHQIIGFLEGLNWNAIIKTVLGWLQNVNFSSIIDGILRWLDSTFFGGSSSPSPTPAAASNMVSRASGIDWASTVQRGLLWAEKNF